MESGKHFIKEGWDATGRERHEVGQAALPGLWVAVEEREGGRVSKIFPERVTMTG